MNVKSMTLAALILTGVFSTQAIVPATVNTMIEQGQTFMAENDVMGTVMIAAYVTVVTYLGVRMCLALQKLDKVKASAEDASNTEATPKARKKVERPQKTKLKKAQVTPAAETKTTEPQTGTNERLYEYLTTTC